MIFQFQSITILFVDDHSRVVLCDTKHDYINANFIDVSIAKLSLCCHYILHLAFLKLIVLYPL